MHTHTRARLDFKVHHPDRGAGDEASFRAIKAAFDHLVLRGGRGTQKNQKHARVELIAASNQAASDAKTATTDDADPDLDLFQARLLTVLSDFGSKGFPIPGIAKRWNQIFPNEPFPTEYIVKRVSKVAPRACACGCVSARV